MSKLLDPQAKALMDIVARAAAPAFHTLDVAKARDETRKLHAYFSVPRRLRLQGLEKCIFRGRGV